MAYEGFDNETTTLVMNKGVSTPYNCAQRKYNICLKIVPCHIFLEANAYYYVDISEHLMKNSVVAEVNGEIWDLHRPIPSDCTLKLLSMKPEDQHQASLVNKTFWRSCSYLLGAVVEGSFQDDISVTLHSFPPANGNNNKFKKIIFIDVFFYSVRSGSFVYDVQLSLDDWVPSLVSEKVANIFIFCKISFKWVLIFRTIFDKLRPPFRSSFGKIIPSNVWILILPWR